MEVETLGIARSLGWRVHMRCSNGYREGTKSMRRCIYRKQLDLDTLVCTRGPNFPLFALGIEAHVPGLWKSPRNGRVRIADQDWMVGGLGWPRQKGPTESVVRRL